MLVNPVFQVVVAECSMLRIDQKYEVKKWEENSITILWPVKISFERGRIIGMRGAGFSFKEIAYCIDRNVTTVLRCLKVKWSEEGGLQIVKNVI